MSLEPNRSLILDALAPSLQSKVSLHTFAELHSTSVWLRDRYMNGVSGNAQDGRTHICITDWQTAGIARRGKTWQTQPGNITFSILSSTKKPAKDLLGLSLVTGIGVANALSDFVNIVVQLKWPNDVLFSDLKLGGLLTELNSVVTTGDEIAHNQVLTGIGINFLHDENVLDLGIGATSLESIGVEPVAERRDCLIAKLASEVLLAHQRFYESGWSVFADRWQSLDWLFNKSVMVHSQNAAEQAVARGVNEQGALLIERDGRTFPIYGGDVSIRPTI